MRNERLKVGRAVRNIALIVASETLFAAFAMQAAEPPPGLLKKIADREAANAEARDNYTYRQALTVQELDTHGGVMGEYRETRDVIYSPDRGRSEQAIQTSRNTLIRIKLTPEDFFDIRNVVSLLLTPDKVSLYESQYKGEETIDGQPCFVVFVRPRQILAGQRFFQGLLWARQSDLGVLRSSGQAVPEIDNLKEQNLFPHFTTTRKLVDDQWLFPSETIADDTLYFRNWPQRVRFVIRYSNYKRFGSESTVTYGTDQPPPPPPPK